MTAKNAYIIQDKQVIVFVNNKSFTVARTTVQGEKLLTALRNNDWETAEKLLDVASSLNQYSEGKLEIKAGKVLWEGKEFHNALSARLIKMHNDSLPLTPLINFIDRIKQNPSYRAVNELYGFLESNNLPITTEGKFLAYKRVHKLTQDKNGFVAGDLVDDYTKKIRNNPGDEPSMPRNEVNDNPNDTCSEGLHFAAMSYLTSSGYCSNGVLLVVEVDPADVVSIPVDYNRQKGRACKYKVLSIYGESANDIENDVVVDAATVTDVVVSAPQVTNDAKKAAMSVSAALKRNNIVYGRYRAEPSSRPNAINGISYRWTKMDTISRTELTEINTHLTGFCVVYDFAKGTLYLEVK